MTEYPKIETVWKRAERKPRLILLGDYARPEFQYLAKNEWVGTEKIDGTNVRVMWDGKDVRFGGKTDNAQLPVPLLNGLQELFGDIDKFIAKFGRGDTVCLYGEGFGGKIQNGIATYGPEIKFALFDVRIGPWWLRRDDVDDIANCFGVDSVSVVARGSLEDLCVATGRGLRSVYGGFNMEGLVMQPAIPLFNRKGERIIAKIKTKDYQALERQQHRHVEVFDMKTVVDVLGQMATETEEVDVVDVPETLGD